MMDKRLIDADALYDDVSRMGLADVMLSASVLFGCEFDDNDSRNLCEEVSDEIADIAGEKLDRWRSRLLARPWAKTIEVKEDKEDG